MSILDTHSPAFLVVISSQYNITALHKVLVYRRMCRGKKRKMPITTHSDWVWGEKALGQGSFMYPSPLRLYGNVPHLEVI